MQIESSKHALSQDGKSIIALLMDFLGVGYRARLGGIAVICGEKKQTCEHLSVISLLILF